MPLEIQYEGRKFKVAKDIRTHEGRTIVRDVVLHPGAVAILPLLDDEHLVMLRNTRPAVGEVLWEIPAGTLEPPEPPEKAAIRELAEETGYTAASWEKVLELYPSPGVLSEKMHLYVAGDLTEGTSRPEDDEQLEPVVVAWSQALEWIADNTIRDAKTIVALLWWQRHRS